MLSDDALERFLRYVRIDTRADEHSTSRPSSPGQTVLLELLVRELHAIGIADAALDAASFVTATIPATVGRDVPVIGFLAHVDTSPEMPGEGVEPIVHRRWDGRDIHLPHDPTAVLRATDHPALAARIGDDIVTASGRTLLGADDKAGVAAIMAAAAHLMAHPEIPHGPVRLAFTPDEEIGRGVDGFDVERFGAVCAYTLDGGSRGELEFESFSADALTLTFTGFNTHPGYAKGRMVNALKVASDFITRLPRAELSPETTDGRQGYVHPYQMHAGVDHTTVRVLLRDFSTARLRDHQARVEQLARDAASAYPGASVRIDVDEQYRNMREVIERHPLVLEYARDAMRAAGVEPVEKPIRGGTDGSRLSFMGLPTPNLFAGEHNFHSRLEWVSAEDMGKAAEVVVELCRRWGAHGGTDGA